MKLASRVFRFAGVYGLLVLAPQYFTEGKLGADYPPAITHPEFYYGFLGVALSWQIGFLLISKNPLRYRVMMIPSILEKTSFGFAVLVLFFCGRTSSMTLAFGTIDLMLAAAFVLAYRKTADAQEAVRV